MRHHVYRSWLADERRALVTALDGGQNTKKVQTGFTVITQENLNGEGGAAAYKSSC